MSLFLWIAIIVVAAILLGYVVTIFNGLIRLKNNIKKAASNIDVLLKQRSDELTKLLESVKGYMKYEKDVLTEVTKARTAVTGASSMKEKAAANNQLDSVFKTLFAVAENYPKLQASESFKQLQERISSLEDSIADRREFYNDSVNNFNIRIESIPDIVVARMLGYTQQELFEASAEDRKDVKIEF